MAKKTFSPATVIGLLSSALSVFFWGTWYQFYLIAYYEPTPHGGMRYEGFNGSTEEWYLLFSFFGLGLLLLFTTIGVFLRQYWSLILLQITWAVLTILTGGLFILNYDSNALPLMLGTLSMMVIIAYMLIRWCNAPWVKPLFKKDATTNDILDQDLF